MATAMAVAAVVSVAVVQAVQMEIATRVSAPFAKLTAIRQMHAEYKNLAQEGGNNDERICFQCRLSGHVKVDSIFYKRIKEWWEVKKATATAALTTPGDCDLF
jgi:hypothetical protein